MPLPGSGALALSQIRTEFGGSNPVSLSQYYRGGARVPNTPTNANVPASGAISIGSFYNSSAVVALHSVSISPNPVYDAGQTGTPGGTVTVTTPAATASVTGGVGPFTYSWQYVSGDTVTSVNSPSSATTTFTRSRAAPVVDGNSNYFSGTYRCVVTDLGNGGVQAYADVNVNTDHIYSFF